MTKPETSGLPPQTTGKAVPALAGETPSPTATAPFAESAVPAPSAAPTAPCPPPSNASPSAGRPRDPGIEERAARAALEIYGRLGWSGFTLGKVAVAAGLGKSALYLRWKSKEELLVFAFSRQDAFYFRGEESLGADLPFAERIHRIARHRLAMYFSPVGMAMLRMMIENQAHPEAISPVWEKSLAVAVMRTREMLRSAIDDGELLPETNIVHLGDSLEGAMVMHTVATPSYLRDEVAAAVDTYAASLVSRTLEPWLTPRAKTEYRNYAANKPG